MGLLKDILKIVKFTPSENKVAPSHDTGLAMRDDIRLEREIELCPYCSGKDIVKRGLRKKKYETAQLYWCNKCKRTFTAQKVKGRMYPLRVILEGLCLYNIGYSLEECCRRLKEQFGIDVKISTLHKAKLALILQERQHARFENLREFLEAVQAECPHQFFQEGERASELKVNFDIDDVILRQRSNFANRIADLVLQAVDDNKLRHLTLQKFMLCNDSVTVATEAPVYMAFGLDGFGCGFGYGYVSSIVNRKGVTL